MASELAAAADQLRRLLLALPALEGGDAHSIAEIAEKVGASVDTVARDLRTLVTRTGDEPGGFFERIQLGFDADRVQLHANVLKWPMALSPNELRAIELGLDMLRNEVPPEETGLVERARERVRAAAVVTSSRGRGSRDGDRAEVSPPTCTVTFETGALETAQLAIVREAISKRCKAHMQYHAGESSECSDRTVRPYGLVFTNGAWFLVAYCETREDVRVFRVDRVANARVLADHAVTVPDEFSLADVLRHGRALASEASEWLCVRYSPAIARWIQEQESGEWGVDGSFVVNHPLLDDQWALRHALQYGADAEVLSPPRIRDAMRARLVAALGGSTSA